MGHSLCGMLNFFASEFTKSASLGSLTNLMMPAMQASQTAWQFMVQCFLDGVDPGREAFFTTFWSSQQTLVGPSMGASLLVCNPSVISLEKCMGMELS